MKRKKKNSFKFAGKKHSKRGKLSLSLAVCSCIAAVGMVVFSIQSGGQANVYRVRWAVYPAPVSSVVFDWAYKPAGRKL